jgi:SlyX protein
MDDLKALRSHVEQLETRIAFQDQTIDDLNTTITDQWKMLESFKRDIARLTDQLQEFEASAGTPGSKEPPPPHY